MKLRFILTTFIALMIASFGIVSAQQELGIARSRRSWRPRYGRRIHGCLLFHRHQQRR